MKKHRRLTWIEKRRIDRIAFDHPFFDVPGNILSRKEAKAIIRNAKDRKTGSQVVDTAYEKAGIPRPAAAEQSLSFLNKLKEIFTVSGLRKIGIIAVAAILLVVFFAFTPIGRAVADTIYHIIVDIIDGSIFAKNELEEFYPPASDFSNLPPEIQSPFELAQLIDYPIVVSIDDEIISFSIDIPTTETMIIRTKYHLQDNINYVIYQELHGSNTLWGNENEPASINTVKTSFGVSMYLLKRDDGVSALFYSEKYNLTITAGCSFETMETIIHSLAIVH